MEIRRANENMEDDFSEFDVAMEAAGEEEEEEIDNSDFVHGLPVPPENNLGVSDGVMSAAYCDKCNLTKKMKCERNR